MTEVNWPPADEHDHWFEEAWRYRDEVVYPQMFGSNTDGSIITIPYVAFAQYPVNNITRRSIF